MERPRYASNYLTPNETAQLLRVTPRTLDNWRDIGFGPSWLTLGYKPHIKIVYDLRAIQSWLTSLQEVQQSPQTDVDNYVDN